jgi:hypothetical protein
VLSTNYINNFNNFGELVTSINKPGVFALQGNKNLPEFQAASYDVGGYFVGIIIIFNQSASQYEIIGRSGAGNEAKIIFARGYASQTTFTGYRIL